MVEELRRRNNELEALHETAVGLTDGLDSVRVLEAIVDRAGRLFSTEHGYLYLVEEDGRCLRSVCSTGIFAHTVGYRLPRGEGAAGLALATGEPVVVDRYREWEHRARDFDHLRIGALVAVPLRAGPEVVGVIGLAFTDESSNFGEPELEVLDRFGRLAALALGNAKLYDDLRHELVVRARAEEDLHQAIARLRRSEAELAASREEMISRLASAVEFRDVETGRHTERMGDYCSLLARRLGLDDEHCELIRVASGLHDIGKIGIPDSVLLKPASLTAAEREVVEQHARIGHSILAGSSSRLLALAATIALTHHERYDGTGYPRGLAGEEIPLEGRIAAVADVFDALISDRPYRPAYQPDEAFAMMVAGRGTQFDARVLDLLPEIVPGLAGAPEPPRSVTAKALLPRPAAAPDPEVPVFPIQVLLAAVDSGEQALRSRSGGRAAIGAALEALVEAGGDDLLPSVYVVEHERLWLVAQQGYDRVRDGFALDQGVIARAARTGELQYVADVGRDPDFLVAADRVRSEIAVPFGEGPAPAGVLNVETRRHTLPPETREALARLARALGERVEEMRQGVGLDLSSLARLFVDASSLRSVGSIAEFSARTLGRLLGLEAAFVCIRQGGGRLAPVSVWHSPEAEPQQLTSDDLELAAREAELAGSTCCILDLSTIGVACEPGDPYRRLIWLPLQVGGESLGALVGRGPETLSLASDQFEAATLLAQHAASQLDAALALRREQRAAVTDELTGLLNRRGFRERSAHELERATRSGRPLGLIVLDCDDLKAVNDRGGHELGDAVLQMVADFIRDEKRPEDVAARLGGDEFGLVVPGVEIEEATEMAERLRRGLIERGLQSGYPVSATLGVAAYPAQGTGLHDLLRAADRAMYGAKADGKNRTRSVASSA
jgi:diguanylate cyclase (GGDEF)-like protein